VIYSFVLSSDYTFPNSFYIHTEVLHNNIGVEEQTSLYKQEKNLGLLTPANGLYTMSLHTIFIRL